jgi:CRISPR/Cas system-associated endonuclease/helicase Cas3
MEYLDHYLQMLLQLHGLQEMDLPMFVEVSHSSNEYYSWNKTKDMFQNMEPKLPN